MINSDTKVRVSYVEPGSTLKSRGIYSSAEVKVGKNGNEKVIKPSQTTKSAKYGHNKKTMLLEAPFVQYWITKEAWKPNFSKPNNAAERMKLSVAQKWKELDKEKILIAAVKMLLADLRINYDDAEIVIL